MRKFIQIFKFSTISTLKSTPKEILNYLNTHIIGQEDAKKAVAIALRNRWRRSQLPTEMKEEVIPKNILMIGPTGCGKTEIARRLAKLSDSPFIKVEATKFTEVGYHGKDVEEIIINLTSNAVRESKHRLEASFDEHRPEIQQFIERIILEILIGKDFKDEKIKEEKLLYLREGFYDARMITLDIPDELTVRMSFLSIESAIEHIKTIKFGNYPKNRYHLTISESKDFLNDIFKEKIMTDIDTKKAAIKRVEEDGIVFLDEIDKIASSNQSPSMGKSPSTDGVQRDLLPIIEGTTVNTKYGDVKTDNILFIASGAFSNSQPADMIPELLGRLPIRINLKALTKEDFIKILTITKHNLLEQQVELLKVDGAEVEFTEDGIDKIAELSFQANNAVENIGARRLHSVVEKIVEEISYEAPSDDLKGIKIDAEFVEKRLKDYIEVLDLKRFLI